MDAWRGLPGCDAPFDRSEDIAMNVTVERRGLQLDLEPAIAAVLDRRQKNRKRGPYRPREEAEIQGLLQSFVAAQPGYAQSEVTQVKRLSGGASKEQFSFMVAGKAVAAERMVLRMDPLESVVETSREREFQALRAFDGRVPVPKAVWLDADGSHFKAPTIITNFVNGVTRPSGAPTANVSGLGLNIGAEWRDEIGQQFLTHLIEIHRMEWNADSLSAFALPNADPQQAARWQIDWWTRVWLEDAVEANPMLAVIEGWLRDNIPPCHDYVFCHNDYRSGNYLIDEQARSISAVLDWEMAHFGDFHDDLSGIIVKVFGHPDEKGEFLVSGLMPRQAFLERYMELSERIVNPQTLHYYEVLNNYKSLVIILATAYRIAVERHNHQNILQTWLVPCAHVFLAEICRLLDEGCRQ
ncbi:MAG: phosphotransferase family protein [Novosphingobium sp.]